MKSSPIRFNAPMVRALLAGTKTQTRRLMKPQPHDDYCMLETGCYHPTVIDRNGEEQPGAENFGAWTQDGEQGWICPYGQPGDLLMTDGGITLEIISIRVERLQDISEQDAMAEGAPGYEEGFDSPPPDNECEWSYVASFVRLWESIYGAGSWDLNPWVWVVEFKRVEGGAA